MAAQQPPRGENGPRQCTMLFQRLQRVGRTRGFETARIAEPGLQCRPVRLHEPYQYAARPWAQGREGPPGRCLGLAPISGACHNAARLNRASSSARAALRSAIGAADLNRRASIGVLNRSTHLPCGR